MRVQRGQMRRVMPRDRQRRPDGRPFLDLRPGERPSERRPIVNDAHVPVMVEEVLRFLDPRPGTVVVDGTVGAGGHAEAILQATGGGVRLIGVDRDPVALEWAGHRLERFGAAVTLVRARFDELPNVLRAHDIDKVHGLLLDLGMSSMQVDAAARGFAFRRSGPLDMRMDPSIPVTAQDVVNTYPVDSLERILRGYGEERSARRIARAIVDARRRSPIRTTDELADIVYQAYPPAQRRGTHPARRTFQALRIEVNDELGSLERLLRSLPAVLEPAGRVVVLSYHSLEDRMVKRIFGELAGPPAPLPGLPPPPGQAKVRVLRASAVLPSEAEVARNPRASSARLRAAERT